MYPEICDRDEIENSRHAEAKADTTSGVWRNGGWPPQATCPPSRGGFSHVRMPRITVETAGALVVENIQLVFYCTCAMWISSRQCQPCRQPGRVRRRGSVFENIPTVVVLHTLLIFEGCVNAFMRWARQVVFLRRCHVQSHPERSSSPTQL